jgi:RimJ/RimL family protein N-acetyltransferase
MAPTLETDRLIVRPWREADVEHWVAMNADVRVMEFFPSVPDRAQSEESAARLRARLDADGFGWWIIAAKSDGAFAGAIALQNVPFTAHFTPAIEIGWRLPYERWGNGYATEAARAVLDLAFGELGLAEVVAMTAALNLRSQRVMQRLGMTRDLRDDFEHERIEPGHRLRPHVLYRLRRP